MLVAGLLVLYMALYVGGVRRDHGDPGPPLRRARAVARAGGVGRDRIPARHHLFGGFPWIPLGNTMVTLLPIAQLASVVGVYGLSLFVALLNAGFAVAAMSERPHAERVAVAATLAADRCGVGVGRHAAARRTR